MRMIRVSALIVAAVAAVTLSAGTANAAEKTAAPTQGTVSTAVVPYVSASCIQIGRTYRTGNYVEGYGSVSCSGSSANLTIQQSRWYGWQDVAQAAVPRSGYDQYVDYYCVGTGTHTFRTIIWGYNVEGLYVQKESNHVTVTC